MWRLSSLVLFRALCVTGLWFQTGCKQAQEPMGYLHATVSSAGWTSLHLFWVCLKKEKKKKKVFFFLSFKLLVCFWFVFSSRNELHSICSECVFNFCFCFLLLRSLLFLLSCHYIRLFSFVFGFFFFLAFRMAPLRFGCFLLVLLIIDRFYIALLYTRELIHSASHVF